MLLYCTALRFIFRFSLSMRQAAACVFLLRQAACAFLFLFLLAPPGARAKLRGEAAPGAAEDERSWWRLAWDHTVGWHDDTLRNPFKIFVSCAGLVSRPIANLCHLLGHHLGVVDTFNELVPALSKHNISALYAYYAGYTAEL